MSEEEIINKIEQMISNFKKIDIDTYKKEDLWTYCKYEHFLAIQGLLDLYNKQKDEIERLKNDKKKALNYINQEMYVDTNPTICEMENEENTIIELPISLNLYNEDLRKLFDLLEEE